MNRMALISIALCAVLLATVGAGVVTAKQGMNPGKHNGVDRGRGRGVGVGTLPRGLEVGTVVTGTLTKFVSQGHASFYIFASDAYGTFNLGASPEDALIGAYVGHQATATVTDITQTPSGNVYSVNVVISGDGAPYHAYMDMAAAA